MKETPYAPFGKQETVCILTNMKSPRIDNIVCNKDRMTANRNFLIELRDAALAASNFDIATELSLTIAFLAEVIERLD